MQRAIRLHEVYATEAPQDPLTPSDLVRVAGKTHVLRDLARAGLLEFEVQTGAHDAWFWARLKGSRAKWPITRHTYDTFARGKK
jgi:hypothetical protein